MLTHNLHNFSELEDRIALLHMQQKEVNTSVVSLESQIRHLREMLKYAEQYILEEKYRLSRMKSKSAFLRKMILYGFVYEVDYSHIRKMNTLLGNISSNLNQITRRINSTNTVYQKDLDDIKELMEKIWQLQKSMVSKQPLIKQ